MGKAYFEFFHLSGWYETDLIGLYWTVFFENSCVSSSNVLCYETKWRSENIMETAM